MAYNLELASRIRAAFANLEVTERKMFGGIAYMMNGNMVCGVIRDDLMARVGADQYEYALGLPGVRDMDPFGGRPMKGMVMVEGSSLVADEALQEWLDRCVQFVATLPAKVK
jgi:TfoX/Sxy family transcriptional regulator of competence genes